MTIQTDPTPDDAMSEELLKQEATSTAENPPRDEQGDEIARLREQLSRARADYENLVRRNEEERRSMGRFILGNTVTKILPLADNLGRALASVPADLQDHAWVAGIRSIEERLFKDLASLGVRPFESVGAEVDPDRHDVMSQAPGEAGIVVAEFERGYLIEDHVLRHAKVVAGSGE
ncbi:MAG TPA: nucleotide exchange factor GrpE [bacterium]|nr:nucleotide exchange factor GrpE [bacterium]